jgi:NAD(P)-dependent dehydrogenase (short-subunit alcohol dehydrogenase family)
MSVDGEELLKPGLLDGVAIAVAVAAAGGGDGGVAAAVRDRVATLGGVVATVELQRGESPEAQEAAAEAALGTALERLGSLQTLVVDGASLFERAGGGREGLTGCLAGAWDAARAVAQLAFLPAGAGGRIVLLAPPAGAEHAGPAAAGLENLARTLSIEWARHGITTVALAPGARTAPTDIATLVAYLASPAGAYFSGCLLDMRGSV